MHQVRKRSMIPRTLISMSGEEDLLYSFLSKCFQWYLSFVMTVLIWFLKRTY